MKSGVLSVVTLAIVALLCRALPAAPPKVVAGGPPPASAPAEAPTSQPAASTEWDKAFNDLVVAYLNDRHSELADLFKPIDTKYGPRLNPDQRKKVAYMHRVSAEERPAWWVSTKSPSNVSFRCVIWGKSIMANYTPADELGMQAPVDIRNGKLVTIVAWRPTQVDNPREADGVLAKKLAVTKGSIGEVVVWHELGHNYLTTALSANDAIDLYNNHLLLFGHLQEFFADMTSLYHASPKARMTTMLLRLDALDPSSSGGYRELEPHTRGGHAIGSFVLAEVLTDPSKWPHMHLPAVVPDKEIELKTIVYLYEHFDKDWSLDEDMAMKELAGKLVRTSGDAIFRSKGMVPLVNKLTFSLMEANDREFQVKRDAWVKEKLEKAIAGRADPAEKKSTRREMRIEIPYY